MPLSFIRERVPTMNKTPDAVSAHDAVFDNLPWLANDTLPAKAAAQARAHLQHCRVCREELNLINGTYDSMKQAAAADGDIERGLARTMNRIDEFETQQDRLNNAADAAPRGRFANALQRSLTWIQTRVLQPQARWMTSAVAASLVLVIGALWLVPLMDDRGSYSVLTTPGDKSPALALEVRLHGAQDPAAVVQMVQQEGLSATVKALDDKTYRVQLPDGVTFEQFNAVFSRIRQDARVDSIEAVLSGDQ